MRIGIKSGGGECGDNNKALRTAEGFGRDGSSRSKFCGRRVLSKPYNTTRFNLFGFGSVSLHLQYTKNFLPVQPQFLGVLGPNRSRPNGVRHLYFGQENEVALSQVRP